MAMFEVVTEHFAIYEHPSDLPWPFAVRGHRVFHGVNRPVPRSEPLALTTSIEAARAALRLLRPGLINVGRFPGDDPVIAEVWI